MKLSTYLIPSKDLDIRKIRVKSKNKSIPVLIIRKKNLDDRKRPCLLWIHGGGYFSGMKEMVYGSAAMDLLYAYDVTVVALNYTLSLFKPYPAALEDCYEVLSYINRNADKSPVNASKIMVGGESAGGGLAAALCMYARDKGEIKIDYQIPLYPMLDNHDTESSKDNHGRVWNTWKNHMGWRLYLRKDANKDVSPYASPSRQTDYRDLPPCYTFVGDGEPFYSETLAYVEKLKKAGVEAHVDVYHSDLHAFDMWEPESEIARDARKNMIFYLKKDQNSFI